MLRYEILAACLILDAAACAVELDAPPQDELGVTMQALDSTHTRVIQECSQAMSGSWWTYNDTNWPTDTRYATYAYTSADAGAWNLLLDNTYNGPTRGWWTSCKGRLANPPQYTPCNLAAGTGYGDLDTPISSYTCQGSCATAPYFRGGQCKPFMNLVAYRSGTYQAPSFGFKLFPNDTCITYTKATCTLPAAQRVVRPSNDADMPLVPFTTLVPGDYLRRPNGHAAIVVRITNASNVVVIDSNFVGGDGAERVASHPMTLSSLAQYRVLKCAYTGAC